MKASTILGCSRVLELLYGIGEARALMPCLQTYTTSFFEGTTDALPDDPAPPGRVRLRRPAVYTDELYMFRAVRGLNAVNDSMYTMCNTYIARCLRDLRNLNTTTCVWACLHSPVPQRARLL
jgi:hypothetical protein